MSFFAPSSRGRAVSLLVACWVAAGAGCSFVTDLNGLTTGAGDGGAGSPSVGGGLDAGTGVDGSVSGDAGTLGTGSGDDGAASVTAVEDGAVDAGVDAPVDAGEDAGVDAGCGETNTVENCSACGVACAADSGAPSCNGTTCSYACHSGYSDCDKGAAPDTNGCECATPACCETGCQTTHADGTGESFYDCNPPSTFTSASAIEACIAFAKGNTSACSDLWTCDSDSTNYVCDDPTSNVNDCTTCWGYTGPNAGKVVDCNCPWTAKGSWN